MSLRRVRDKPRRVRELRMVRDELGSVHESGRGHDELRVHEPEEGA